MPTTKKSKQERIRDAITAEAWKLGERFDIPEDLKAVLATRMIHAVESVK